MLDSFYHMMRNARFGPLTLLMTLRVMTSKVKTNLRDYFTFQSMTLTSDSRPYLSETDISFRLSYKLSTMNQRLPRNP